jgi:hypothetical protein
MLSANIANPQEELNKITILICLVKILEEEENVIIIDLQQLLWLLDFRVNIMQQF